MAENKQYITQTQENGSVMISEDVVMSIVAHAVSEVEGVVSISSKPVAELADMIGATSEIISYAKSQKGKVIIGTERGVVDYLAINEENGDRFIQLAPEKLCCEDMKKITLEDVYKAIIGEGGEKVELDEDLRKKALKSINRMLELG